MSKLMTCQVGKTSGKRNFQDQKQVIHESRILHEIITRHMHSVIHESRFLSSNFHASRTNVSPYHSSRINPLPPSKSLSSKFRAAFMYSVSSFRSQHYHIWVNVCNLLAKWVFSVLKQFKSPCVGRTRVRKIEGRICWTNWPLNPKVDYLCKAHL